jgi:hypothetical protein
MNEPYPVDSWCIHEEVRLELYTKKLEPNFYDLLRRTVQERLGHKDVKTTMIYIHVLQRGRLAVKNPSTANNRLGLQYF